MNKHLWEVDHAYYCNEGNYYAAGDAQPHVHHKSWSDFLAEMHDADRDYNLLFRWDWKEGDDYELPPYNGDDNYRNGILCLYFMGQRKGLYMWHTIEVCRADERAVIEYLKPLFEHLKSLWEPMS